jgi:hypothetical protein
VDFTFQIKILPKQWFSIKESLFVCFQSAGKKTDFENFSGLGKFAHIF